MALLTNPDHHNICIDNIYQRAPLSSSALYSCFLRIRNNILFAKLFHQIIILNLEMEKSNFSSDSTEVKSELQEERCEQNKESCENDKEKTLEHSERSNDDTECENDSVVEEILNEILNCPVIFQSQQIGDPELSVADKTRIAKELLHHKPVTFLLKFGEFLKEKHLNYFFNKFSSSYEVQYHVKYLKNLLSDHNKRLVKRNRRYEAMKRMEAEGSYFSETEMEKREPLLYHQMVGQYLSEKEKLQINRQAQKNVIPSFSNFLIQQMERDEIDTMIKLQQEKEDNMEEINSSSEEEVSKSSTQNKRWGDDWEDEKLRKKTKKKQPNKVNTLSKEEKNLLRQEFKSIMKNNFLNGKDADFNYSEVDLNPDYDSVDLRAQDEEEKYFDEETNDETVCTDTGIEDY